VRPPKDVTILLLAAARLAAAQLDRVGVESMAPSCERQATRLQKPKHRPRLRLGADGRYGIARPRLEPGLF